MLMETYKTLALMEASTLESKHLQKKIRVCLVGTCSAMSPWKKKKKNNNNNNMEFKQSEEL